MIVNRLPDGSLDIEHPWCIRCERQVETVEFGKQARLKGSMRTPDKPGDGIYVYFICHGQRAATLMRIRDVEWADDDFDDEDDPDDPDEGF